MKKLSQTVLADVQLVGPDATGYSTVSAGVASVEVEAPALACPARWSLLAVALLPVPASLVVRNRVPLALTEIPVYRKLLVHCDPTVWTAMEHNTLVE